MRFYDPGIARFIVRDMLPPILRDDPNLFRYVRDNPVRSVDPVGLAGTDEDPGGFTTLGRLGAQMPKPNPPDKGDPKSSFDWYSTDAGRPETPVACTPWYVGFFFYKIAPIACNCEHVWYFKGIKYRLVGLKRSTSKTPGKGDWEQIKNETKLKLEDVSDVLQDPQKEIPKKAAEVVVKQILRGAGAFGSAAMYRSGLYFVFGRFEIVSEWDVKMYCCPRKEPHQWYREPKGDYKYWHVAGHHWSELAPGGGAGGTFERSNPNRHGPGRPWPGPYAPID